MDTPIRLDYEHRFTEHEHEHRFTEHEHEHEHEQEQEQEKITSERIVGRWLRLQGSCGRGARAAGQPQPVHSARMPSVRGPC